MPTSTAIIICLKSIISTVLRNRLTQALTEIHHWGEYMESGQLFAYSASQTAYWAECPLNSICLEAKIQQKVCVWERESELKATCNSPHNKQRLYLLFHQFFHPSLYLLLSRSPPMKFMWHKSERLQQCHRNDGMRIPPSHKNI